MKLKPMLNTAKFFLYQNKPTIKAVGGVGLMAVATVWACKSAVKIHEERALTNLDIDDITADDVLTEEEREEQIKQSKKEIRMYTSYHREHHLHILHLSTPPALQSLLLHSAGFLYDQNEH